MFLMNYEGIQLLKNPIHFFFIIFFYFSKVRNISAQLERVFEEKSLIQSDLSVKVIDAQS